MIDVTGVNMVELVKKAYDLSRPQGMGMLHFTPDPLSDEEAQDFIQSNGEVHLDYVRGRACKFNVFNKDGKFEIRDSWYDHTDKQLVELMAHVGITIEAGQSDHGCACNCDTCRVKRGDSKLNPESDFDKALKAREDGTAFNITGFNV